MSNPIVYVPGDDLPNEEGNPIHFVEELTPPEPLRTDETPRKLSDISSEEIGSNRVLQNEGFNFSGDMDAFKEQLRRWHEQHD